jgi:RNA polymerase sigma-70 factor, ECF subfamily
LDGRDQDELDRIFRAGLAGDERAYAEFLRRAASLVRSFVRKRIPYGKVEIEDIVQETLIAIHMKRHTWRVDRPAAPWVYAIARHKLVDAFRRQGRRVEIEIGEVTEMAIAEPEVRPLQGRDVARALATLAPRQRSVVATVSVEGRSISEAAQTLGMSEPAVRVALHRGLASLARRFGRV